MRMRALNRRNEAESLGYFNRGRKGLDQPV